MIAKLYARARAYTLRHRGTTAQKQPPYKKHRPRAGPARI